MKEIFKAVQDASRELLALTEEQINEILLAVADATIANAAYILSENQKLKNVIEILKRDFQFEIQDDFLWIYDNYCGALETFSLNEDEINLLKEVLNND